MPRLTLEALEALETETLTCKQVAGFLGLDQSTLHLQAQTRPDMLGFPVICAGTRVKIPRRAFIKFMRGEFDAQEL